MCIRDSLIAAAAAALLLFVVLGALNLGGRSGDDSASVAASVAAAEDTADVATGGLSEAPAALDDSESSNELRVDRGALQDDAAESPSFDQAEEAMEDEEEDFSVRADSALGAAGDAAEDEAMEDEEEAAAAPAPEVFLDRDFSGSLPQNAAIDPSSQLFRLDQAGVPFFGNVASNEVLLDGIQAALPAGESLSSFSVATPPGDIVSCQESVVNLMGRSATLFGIAIIDGIPTEIHVLDEDEFRSFYFVEPDNGCEVRPIVQLQADQ